MDTATWITGGLAAWTLLALPAAVVFGRAINRHDHTHAASITAEETDRRDHRAA